MKDDDLRLWNAFALAAIALVAAWLIASLVWVNIEFDDGYATIANSQYLLGSSAEYFWLRAPLLALGLVPAEWLSQALGLHPLDVRAHHAAMALLHVAYLVGVWRLLARHFGGRRAVLIAFLAALPTVLFFSYAAFISHDLFPGLLTLSMLMLAEREVRMPSRASLAMLVVVGAALPLIKQTYALVWPAALVAVAVSMWLTPGNRIDFRALARLCAAAVTSAVITWLGYCAVLAHSFADLPLLLKPLGQYAGVYRQIEQTGAITDLIDQWLYLRNLSAYGMLAMMLIGPGLWFSLRSASTLQRTLAVAWIVLVAAMQIMPFKEVRYLGYLAPLTAFLIVPAIDFLTQLRRTYLYLCIGVLTVDLSLGASEALRLQQPYYFQEVTQFLADLPVAPGSTPQVVLNAPLSFISPELKAFRNDRFHRITHVIADEIRMLYGYPAPSMLTIRDESLLEQHLRPGAIVYFVNGMASRRPPFRPDNRPDIDEGFIQAATVAEQVQLVREGDDYRLDPATSQPLMLLGARGTQQQPIGGMTRFSVASVLTLRGLTEPPDTLRLLGFRIRAQCDIRGCRRY